MLRVLSSAARRPLTLAVAHGRHTSAIRLLSTATAAPQKINHDIGYSVVDELERLEVLPWYRSLPLRLSGVFSEDNRQAAAASDMYLHCDVQASDGQLFDLSAGGLENRYYRRVQAKGLHCWMCYARLLQEPKEAWALSDTIRKDMMEKLWEQVTLDLHLEQEMDFITLSGHLKVYPPQPRHAPATPQPRPITAQADPNLVRPYPHPRHLAPTAVSTPLAAQEMQLGWHGFARSMDEALASADPKAALAETLLRNFYADEEGVAPPEAEAAALRLAGYVQAQLAHLRAISTEEMLRARVSWAPGSFS